MTDVDEPLSSGPEPEFIPRNSAMIALWIIGGVGALVGIILLIVGAVMNANVNPYAAAFGMAENPIPGLPAMICGGALLNVGILALIGGLVATAARWQPEDEWGEWGDDELSDDDPDVAAGMARLTEVRAQEAEVPDLRPHDGDGS